MLNRTLPLYLLLLLILSCTNTATQSTKGIVDISPAKFKEMMSEKDVVVIDVRTPGEIAEGKIQRAIELDITGDDFEKGLERLDKDKTYLMYCKGGTRSKKACNIMEGKGFTKLYNMEGGYMAWKEMPVK